MLPKPYFKDDYSALYLADSFDLMTQFPAEYFHVIFADPPYFLSNGGFSCSGGKKISVNKGDWDKISSLEEKHEFNRRWLRLTKRIYVAKKQSAAKFVLQIFYARHGKHFMGAKK